MKGFTPELLGLFVVALAGVLLVGKRAVAGARNSARVFVEIRWVILAALAALPTALALSILVYLGWNALPLRVAPFRVWGALASFGLLSFAFVTIARDLRGSLSFSLPGATRALPWVVSTLLGLSFIGLTARSVTLPPSSGLRYVTSHELTRFGALASGVFFLLGVLSAILPWVLDRLEGMRFDTFIGARHVRATKSGFLTVVSLLSIGGVGFSSFTLCGSVSIMGGFGQDLKRKILGNNAHLIVDRAGSQTGFADFEPLVERVREVPGVMGVTPVVSGDAMASCNANTAGVAVRGIDPKTIGDVIDLVKNIEYGRLDYLDDEERLASLPADEIIGGSSTGEQFKKGTDFSTLKGLDPAVAAVLRGPPVYPGIVIGRELSRTLHLLVGDEVTLVSPLGDLGPMGVLPRARRFRVAAIFYSGMYEYDATHVYLRMDVAQKFLGLEGRVTNIEVKVKDAEATEALIPPVTTAVGDASLRVRDWRELNKNLFSALKLERIVAFLILSIAIAVASFCIICTLLLMVTEKGKEIAIMKALGTSDAAVQRIFMIEGVIIGAIGTTFGVASGVAACLGLRWFGVRLDPDVYYIDRLPVATNATDYLVVAASAMAICTLATIYPAKAASRLRPVDGLRYELPIAIPNMALVSVTDLHKTYDHHGRRLEVLKGIDLSIEAGDCIAIVGPSGTGKSTLLHCIGTLDLPTKGRILLDGQDATAMGSTKLAALRNRTIGFVFQFHHLLPEFTALENVAMPGLVAGKKLSEMEPRASALLEEVGLRDRMSHRPGELSGGEQQRVALARALALEPKLLLADEPTGNLDSATSDAIHDLFFRINKERGTTIVVVTHNPAFAEQMPRVLRMRDGRIEKDDRGERPRGAEAPATAAD